MSVTNLLTRANAAVTSDAPTIIRDALAESYQVAKTASKLPKTDSLDVTLYTDAGALLSLLPSLKAHATPLQKQAIDQAMVTVAGAQRCVLRAGTPQTPEEAQGAAVAKSYAAFVQTVPRQVEE